MASTSDIFQQVRDAVDIVEVVGEHVALKRAGREFKGLCPFHEDHRPSMAVVPHKQIFHCFVCGMGGDVFKFVREFHKMSAGEALRLLAQRGGVKLPELPQRGGRSEDGPSPREQIASTNGWACEFFEKTLYSPFGKAGLEYFHGRGLSDETIRKFRLGMAPDGWTGLVNAAMRLQIPGEKLDQAGLVKRRQDGSAYDVFRGRVMFPITDATGGGGRQGRVIAFGGRVLEEKRDEQGIVVEAKYLNTPETRLFNKSEALYGLEQARQHIVRTRAAIVVEGYMDVIACHQAGINNVVATLGTALTPEHTRVLKNYAQTVVLIFDSDDAGRRAADRATQVLVHTPLDVKIASVPDGKDPCDFCMKNGGVAFQMIVDSAQDVLLYKWQDLKSKFQESDSVTARQDAVVQLIRFITASFDARGGMDNIDPIRRGQIVIRLAAVLGLSIDEVTRLLIQYTPLRDRTVARSPENAPNEQKNDGGQPPAQKIAERHIMGFTMHQPSAFELIRDVVDIRWFILESVKAELFLEYFWDTDPSQLSLAGFCDHAREREGADPLTHAVISWERHAARWEDLHEFSEDVAKMIGSAREDRGVTVETVVRDCATYLIEAAANRMRLYKANSTLEKMALEEHLAEIEITKIRNKRGGNVRHAG